MAAKKAKKPAAKKSAAKKPAEGDVLYKINEQDKRVLGVRVDFYHRGVVSFTVHPTAPIPVAGISKTISVWIAGRNFNHTLKVLIDDYFGRPMELTVGKLTFMGWKKLTVAVPPSITRSEQKRKLVRRLPLECLLLESDSPVLGPVAGERNEPANCLVAAREVAELKGVSLELYTRQVGAVLKGKAP
mgnify:CR=1 FL=1